MMENVKNTAWCRDGINMIDCDPDWAVKVFKGALASPETMQAAADRYFDALLTDAKVTDMAFAVFQQTSFVDTESMSWIYRRLAELEAAGKLNVDIAFFATAAISEDGVISDFDLRQTMIRKIVMHNAKESVFLFERDKYGKKLLYTLCHEKDATAVLFAGEEE